LFGACADGLLRAWEVSTGNEVVAFGDGGDNTAWAIDLTHRGDWLVSGAADGSVVVWNPDTGKELARWPHHRHGNVWDVAFSPAGARLVTAADSIALWDIADLVPPVMKPERRPADRGWLALQAATMGRLAPVEQSPDDWAPRLPGADENGLLGVLPVHPAISAIALADQGRRLFIANRSGEIELRDLRNGLVEWKSLEHAHGEVRSIAVSANGEWLISGSSQGDVAIRNRRTGGEPRRFRVYGPAVWDIACSNSRFATVGVNGTVEIWDCDTAEKQFEIEHSADRRANRVAFSPDGRWLAAGCEHGSFWVFDTETRSEHASGGVNGWVGDIAFSPDGRLVATADPVVRLWDSDTGALLLEFAEGTTTEAAEVAFSPDGRWLASANGAVAIWDTRTGQMTRRFSVATDEPQGMVAWAPSGTFVVSSSGQRNIRLWDTRDLAPVVTSSVGLPAGERPLPALERLCGDFAAVARLAIHVPLSLLRDVLDLVRGSANDSPLRALVAHHGVERLRALPWRSKATAALAVLLLRDLELDEAWRPPPDLPPSQIEAALTRALCGTPIPPEAPPPPIHLLTRAADAIDDRVVTLLSALGPDALARDPGLALRLLHDASALPALSDPERRLLQTRIATTDSGAAQGAGAGPDRAGIAPRGPITALVPSQLSLPWALVAFKHETGGLLYRAHSGRVSPRLRPTVLVLDVSPPSFGPVEGVTRAAAFMLASTLRRQNLPVALVAAAGESTTHRLEHPADVLQLLSVRRPHPADVASAMSAAKGLAAELATGTDAEPVVLLLTHPFWGADEARSVRQAPNLRGLFVQYPARNVRPEWADACERWETVRADQHAELPGILGRLLT
jgi:ATP-dependent Clp protease ATP-binding subunit ClpC